ncbi:MAG: low-specificity L-threonine aldolase [Aggregatilineales bacterium]
MDYIDLRSDTVSWPTPEMREAMANAVVGDDIYGEDPTVIALENEAATLLGKEAGLFVTSGHLGNLISIMTHCDRGSEIILGDKAHTFLFETGSISALASVHPHTVPNQEDGTIALYDIRGAIRGDNYHFPRTRLITLENTHNLRGGVPISAEYTAQVAEIARENDLKLHIDGARLFNAANALGVPAKTLVEHADSVTFCLSKGLCAPVGSVIVGDAAFIKEARRNRKMLGGGMRQAGVIAAAGLVAIRTMIDRLGEDHQNACLLAEELAKIEHIQVNTTQTNFVFFDLLPDSPVSPEELIAQLAESYKIKIGLYPGFKRTFRAVTHYWITEARVHEFARAVESILNS